MSADNYWLIRRTQNGFVPVMGFASDDWKPQPRSDAPVFATPDEALDSVIDEYAEYGHSIDPECYLDDADWAAKLETRTSLLEDFEWLLQQEDVDARDLLGVVEHHANF
ncbi:hypothetical protein [Agromyces humi]|uniref:hypothetical protein n=1 Tax=Agromyces humi TaxID=1766800 RepID=UPI00135A638E|nr:hypothetical protein [Agromyces humi]